MAPKITNKINLYEANRQQNTAHSMNIIGQLGGNRNDINMNEF